MASFTIEEIERACGAQLLKRGREPSMDGVSTDTRTIEMGNLFLALKGENFDGHAFLKRRAKKGLRGSSFRMLLLPRSCLPMYQCFS